jgi:hypothetical protein
MGERGNLVYGESTSGERGREYGSVEAVERAQEDTQQKSKARKAPGERKKRRQSKR